MLVASAIADRGLSPTRLYMLDAAVAMEAFDSSIMHIAGMRSPFWYHESGAIYASRLYASKWYDRFPDGDSRRDLTWRDRFGDIPQAINYYSSGEQVLMNHDNSGRIGPSTTKSWIYQERMKGRPDARFLRGVSSQGGWGFNDRESVGYGRRDPDDGFKWRRLTPQEAALLTDEQLQRKSFFKPFECGDLYHPTSGSAVATNPVVRAKVLAEAIPSLSWATGANPVDNRFGRRNLNMMVIGKNSNRWPESRIASDWEERWLHSDFKDIAYFFVFNLFDNIVRTQGRLHE
jgi:hypothetical protein